MPAVPELAAAFGGSRGSWLAAAAERSVRKCVRFEVHLPRRYSVYIAVLGVFQHNSDCCRTRRLASSPVSPVASIRFEWTRSVHQFGDGRRRQRSPRSGAAQMASS